MLARATELLADVDLDPDTGDGLVICPRLRIGDEVVPTATMVARFGATREMTLDELRVELIFPADEAARTFFERQHETEPRPIGRAAADSRWTFSAISSHRTPGEGTPTLARMQAMGGPSSLKRR